MDSDDFDTFESGGLPDFLRDPMGLLHRRWRWMSSALALGVAITLVFAVLKLPRYEAKARVLVTSQQISKDFVRPTIEEDSLQRINAMVGEMLSHEKLGALIAKHDLYPEERKSMPISDVALTMRRSISIESEQSIGKASRFESAQVFAITFEYGDPDATAEVANDLARMFTSENIHIRSEQARLTTAFLRRELEESEGELREQTREITEFKQSHRGELPEDLEANLRKLERLQQQRQSLMLQIAEAETRAAMLSSQMLRAGVSVSPEARLAEVRAKLIEELGLRTERHPDVISLRRQIDLLEGEIAEAQRPDSDRPTSHTALVAAAEGTLQERKAQIAAADAEIRHLDERVARTPARQETLAALEERETVLRETYLEFLRKVQDSELAESLEVAQQGARFSVVDWAVPPANPKTARWKYVMVGLMASLVFATGVGYVLEKLDPVLVRPDQVESESGLPVLGSAPEIS